MTLFRLFGIPLQLHWTFGLLALYVGVMGWRLAGTFWGMLFALAVLALVFACIVAHELGHSLTARAYGIQTRRIVLLPIGGMAQFTRIPRAPKKELLITLAGPAVNFVIVLLLLPLIGPRALYDSARELFGLGGGAFTPGLLEVLALFNLLMGAFNLLPLFPMDGGRILRAVLATRFDYLRATRLAVWTAKPLLIAGIAATLFYGEPPWLPAIVFGFIFLGGEAEYRMVREQEQFAGLKVRDVTRRRYTQVEARATVGDLVRFMQTVQPGDILVTEGGTVRAAFTAQDLRDIAREAAPEDALLDYAELPVTTLEADWSLQSVLSTNLNAPRRLYPVRENGEILGVLDTGRLRETLFWRQLQREMRS